MGRSKKKLRQLIFIYKPLNRRTRLHRKGQFHQPNVEMSKGRHHSVSMKFDLIFQFIIKVITVVQMSQLLYWSTFVHNTVYRKKALKIFSRTIVPNFGENASMSTNIRIKYKKMNIKKTGWEGQKCVIKIPSNRINLLTLNLHF